MSRANDIGILPSRDPEADFRESDPITLNPPVFLQYHCTVHGIDYVAEQPWECPMCLEQRFKDRSLPGDHGNHFCSGCRASTVDSSFCFNCQPYWVEKEREYSQKQSMERMRKGKAVECYICGSGRDPKFMDTVEYDGVIYYFCSPENTGVECGNIFAGVVLKREKEGWPRATAVASALVQREEMRKEGKDREKVKVKQSKGEASGFVFSPDPAHLYRIEGQLKELKEQVEGIPVHRDASMVRLTCWCMLFATWGAILAWFIKEFLF